MILILLLYVLAVKLQNIFQVIDFEVANFWKDINLELMIDLILTRFHDVLILIVILLFYLFSCCLLFATYPKIDDI